MRLLNGAELADFIKERQARQVRALRQAHSILPRLAIVRTTDDPRIAAYVRLKKAYGAEILIDVDEHAVAQADALKTIEQLNADPAIHGIVVQLPLADPTQTDTLVNAVVPAKDIDGLGQNATWQPATPMAIMWLLHGYNIELKGKKIVVVGQGRLVGAPLTVELQRQGLDVTPVDKDVTDPTLPLHDADIIITGTGVPGLITSRMVRPGAVVVDAGTASENGKLVGDVADDVRTRDDLTITPVKGGVGPLTVCALFDNLIRAASATKPA